MPVKNHVDTLMIDYLFFFTVFVFEWPVLIAGYIKNTSEGSLKMAAFQLQVCAVYLFCTINIFHHIYLSFISFLDIF